MSNLEHLHHFCHITFYNISSGIFMPNKTKANLVTQNTSKIIIPQRVTDMQLRFIVFSVFITTYILTLRDYLSEDFDETGTAAIIIVPMLGLFVLTPILSIFIPLFVKGDERSIRRRIAKYGIHFYTWGFLLLVVIMGAFE